MRKVPLWKEEDARAGALSVVRCVAIVSITGEAFAMTRQALVAFTLALAAGLGTSSVFSQTPPNTTQHQPAPDIAGVIKGGTMPEVVIKGLTSSDDSFWLPP
jgi:hypothetical protein